MEEKEKRELFLEVIKNSNSVKLVFVSGYLKEIIISVKKYKELLGNGAITKESIFDIEKIMLIMPDSVLLQSSKINSDSSSLAIT